MKHNDFTDSRRVFEDGTCARCHGFMVPSFTDSLLVETSEGSFLPAQRCVNCGYWIDAVVAENRSMNCYDEADRKSPFTFSQRRWRW